ncbi:acetate/propionate family kinase [Terrilactibacillus laevilacticus]|uniref:Acetate kinase n=1 Tax=Terrilactibacillus laevilacticus TaxID=1380157 RepID=A0ABW5PT05_9BACI|nr:acetate kinase [Terrilactibacillus laevilacticus]
MAKIIAINAGSSSLKFQLLDMPKEQVIAKGSFERIGLPQSTFSMTYKGEKWEETTSIFDHSDAVRILLDYLIDRGVVQSLTEIGGIGHRVVHGGEAFNDSALVTEDVLKKIEDLSELAPLHNPANLVGIRAFQQILPHVPSVVVFDTAFHQSMPKESYLYSLPYEYYENYSIRKYGFHGTSHQYVSIKAAEILNQPIEDLKLISCHLGNGASITAIKGGKSYDTSMGFTPLAGLTMGTRSGDIDPALIPYIMEKTGQNASEVVNVLNKKSGLLGLSGFSSDLRDIESEMVKGHERAKLALSIFVERIQKYIGSYVAKMQGVDAIIFTAGIGENSYHIRENVTDGLKWMGVALDNERNRKVSGETIISTPESKVKVLVIPTNEEVMIARDTIRISERVDS